MTDDEIVKALECCVKNDCRQCPYMAKKVDCVSLKRSENDVLNLINRQKAEIELLMKENKEVWDERNRICKGYREAIDRCHQYRERIFELQKQVDELKEKSKEVNDLVKEKVKNTAREILQEIESRLMYYRNSDIACEFVFDIMDEIARERREVE